MTSETPVSYVFPPTRLSGPTLVWSPSLSSTFPTGHDPLPRVQVVPKYTVHPVSIRQGGGRVENLFVSLAKN